MIENGGDTRRATEMHPPGRPAIVRYLIVRRESTGFESPYTYSHSVGELLTVFSSRETARMYLAADGLGDGWYVREYAGGELVSLLFAIQDGVRGILLDPSPGYRLDERQVLWSLVDQDGFMEFLLNGG